MIRKLRSLLAQALLCCRLWWALSSPLLWTLAWMPADSIRVVLEQAVVHS